MKFHFALLALPLLAIANPLANPEPEPQPEPLPAPLPLPLQRAAVQAGKASRTCKLTGSDVKYRKCPSTDGKKCPALGQYGKKGTKVAFKCWTFGKSVKGNEFWDKTTKGTYVSETLVDTDCAFKLPQC